MIIPHIRKGSWKPRVQGDFEVPRQSWWISPLLNLIGGFYTGFILGLHKVHLVGEEDLVALWADGINRGGRSIMAFRHCGDADPQAVAWVLNRLGRKHLKTLGVKKNPFFIMLASAEIALWGGVFAEFILKKGGTLPLAHGRSGRSALGFLRKHLESSTTPIVLAPEGQITYELQGPINLDPGVASMALWAREALPEEAPVRILPLGLQYFHPQETWERWKVFMSLLEEGVGMKESPDLDLGKRLLNLWSSLLDQGEEYYAKGHGVLFQPEENLSLRAHRLMEVALKVVSSHRGRPALEDPRAEIFRIREENLNTLYSLQNTSPLEVALCQRALNESYAMNRHQELADMLVNIDPGRIPENPTLDQAIEGAMNLADLAGRLGGGTVADRPRYFKRELVITLGDPLSVDESFSGTRKERISAITGRLARIFEELATL